tara:strand:+ start:634 stop:1608 length:975 start_codon:yes stop_codon:yes gene_type:complete
MFKALDPTDINITPFKVYKEFTLTEVDSGSGVYSFRAISSSAYNFDKNTAVKKTYFSASFYEIPSWHMINQMYYRDTLNPYNNFGQNDDKQYRLLQPSASVISVPQQLYGERIKPKSIELKDDSTATTVTVVDDGHGNLYDSDYSSSFATFASHSFSNSYITESTGSFVGNVFYEHGVLAVTNTGSRYVDIGSGTGTDGFRLKYKAQVTINEYEYTCVIGESEFTGTTNISATFEKSGSMNLTGSDTWRSLPPGDALFKSGSYKSKYTQATTFEPFVTNSFFSPYVTKIGLYNDFNDLIAIGQLSMPIKNDSELSLGIVVRFDA